MRGSRPTIANGLSVLCEANSPLSANTSAAATPSEVASSAVSRPFANPRTPSVPKRRSDMLTL